MKIADKRRNYLIENEDFDYILEEHNAPDFYEMVVSVGGDICRLRCYGENEENFRVFEK